DVYIVLRVGMGMSPSIGGNGAGRNVYEKAMARRAEGGSVLIIGSKGPYDFMGFRYRNESSGFTLDRVRVLQGDKTFTFHRDDVIRAGSALGTPVALIVLPPEAGFDPLAPWRAELIAYVKTAGGELAPVPLAALDHQLPAAFVLTPAPEPTPAWMEAWIEDRAEIMILGAALVALTLLLAFQHRLTRSRSLHRWARTGFLLFTLLWLGWVAGGQLSIVHLINYLQAPFLGLDWTFYMAEPLIVIISAYTALSLLLVGRGVFCGWLCPFGALQELMANVARLFHLPQWNPSERVQNRLWMGKYASLALVIGLTFLWPSVGAVATEIEPFKTAITSIFTRTWPYLLYAGALLAIGLFTERAFCRFLCPLGGALALLDRLHLLTLLKRRPECGNPCSLCERACPVRAISASGRIEMAECFHCLDCQVEYHDDKRCPPLVMMRKQSARTATRPEAALAFPSAALRAPAAR
ncbi:MAG: 4Fe-4S binding protein, partial [Paracoccaceae bacterium]